MIVLLIEKEVSLVCFKAKQLQSLIYLWHTKCIHQQTKQFYFNSCISELFTNRGNLA